MTASRDSSHSLDLCRIKPWRKHNVFGRKHSKPPWAIYCREGSDGACTLQLSISHVSAPARWSLDVADSGEKERNIVAMLARLKVGSPMSLDSSGYKTLLAPSQGGDWASTPGDVSEGFHLSLQSPACLVSAGDLQPLCLCFRHMSPSLRQLASCSKVMLIYWQ